MSDREMQNLLNDAIFQLQRATQGYIELVRLRGDDEGRLTKVIQEQRETVARLVSAHLEFKVR